MRILALLLFIRFLSMGKRDVQSQFVCTHVMWYRRKRNKSTECVIETPDKPLFFFCVCIFLLLFCIYGGNLNLYFSISCVQYVFLECKLEKMSVHPVLWVIYPPSSAAMDHSMGWRWLNISVQSFVPLTLGVIRIIFTYILYIYIYGLRVNRCSFGWPAPFYRIAPYVCCNDGIKPFIEHNQSNCSFYIIACNNKEGLQLGKWEWKNRKTEIMKRFVVSPTDIPDTDKSQSIDHRHCISNDSQRFCKVVWTNTVE